jgi:hypothetical protein
MLFSFQSVKLSEASQYPFAAAPRYSHHFVQPKGSKMALRQNRFFKRGPQYLSPIFGHLAENKKQSLAYTF